MFIWGWVTMKWQALNMLSIYSIYCNNCSLIRQVVSLVSVEEWERKALLGETSETPLKSSGVDE